MVCWAKFSERYAPTAASRGFFVRLHLAISALAADALQSKHASTRATPLLIIFGGAPAIPPAIWSIHKIVLRSFGGVLAPSPFRKRICFPIKIGVRAIPRGVRSPKSYAHNPPLMLTIPIAFLSSSPALGSAAAARQKPIFLPFASLWVLPNFPLGRWGSAIASPAAAPGDAKAGRGFPCFSDAVSKKGSGGSLAGGLSASPLPVPKPNIGVPLRPPKPMMPWDILRLIGGWAPSICALGAFRRCL